ncbi:uncharacterized protein TNCV_4181461 [Trichonephila clavipes]|nr:uncharacterized protein TNCV_4181461 [Trichonephila clavipes]
MYHDEIPERCKLNFTGIVDDALRIAGELFPKQTLKKYIRKEVEIDTDGRVRSRRFEKKKKKSLKDLNCLQENRLKVNSEREQDSPVEMGASNISRFKEMPFLKAKRHQAHSVVSGVRVKDFRKLRSRSVTSNGSIGYSTRMLKGATGWAKSPKLESWRIEHEPDDHAVEMEATASEAASETSSAREAARRLGLPPSSVHNILRRIFQLYPYKLQSCNELLPADTAQREAFAKWAFSKMEQDPTWVFNILWTDEALFSLHGDVNNHNCRIWATSNPREYQK